MEDNVYMTHQDWVGYDPAQWVLVTSNRCMFFRVEPPEWVTQQVEMGLKELESTMDRDKFVRDTFTLTMRVRALEMVDVMINSELSHGEGDYEV